MFLEITERLQAQEQIQESLKIKETLLKEIHHRVKNNLQVISGLLDLQKHHLDDEKYRNIFKESQNRVLAMALIHQELYRAEDLESINFGEFIKNLSRTLIGSYTLDGEVVKLELDVQDANIVIDTAIPCGLIINELLTNSIKHAFPEGLSGTILITFRAVGEEEFELIVSDDGVGLPEGLDFTRTGSLGLQLVSILSDQLKCSVTLEREGGTSFSFRFKEYREAGPALY
jgi:two-component sensor histidine kinase